MKMDFHYGVIKLVARAAGFEEEEAQTIAYASQHTDDASRHRDIEVRNLNRGHSLDQLSRSWLGALHATSPEFSDQPVRGLTTAAGKFDPICTATSDIQQEIDRYTQGTYLNMLMGFLKRMISPETQKKLYVPFHFLPGRAPADFAGGEKYHFCTSPGGPLPRRMLQTIIDAPTNWVEPPPFARKLHLIALGVAIHSYADTWAHAGFSGRWNRHENDIDDLFTNEDNFDDSKDLSVAPDLGHSEALHTVDEAHVELRFQFEHPLPHRDQKVPDTGNTRENWREYTAAARSIYDHLLQMTGSAKMAWGDLEEKLVPILRAEMGALERIDLMRASFEDTVDAPIRFFYSKVDWENRVRNVPWTGEGTPDHTHTFDPEAEWFLFHVAALAQRSMIMPMIEDSWS